MKPRFSNWITAGAIALGLTFTATSFADIQDVQPQPTVYMNMSFGGAGDDTIDNTVGFRVDYDVSQISRRLHNTQALPSMLKAEYGSDGKVYLYSNGIPLNQHDYRLNADGNGSFGALDFVGALGAIAAGYFIYDNVENDDDNNTPSGGTGDGGDMNTGGTMDGGMCTSDADCMSGTCNMAGGMGICGSAPIDTTDPMVPDTPNVPDTPTAPTL